MGMPQPIADWTVERILALPDDENRYEVVDVGAARGAGRRLGSSCFRSPLTLHGAR